MNRKQKKRRKICNTLDKILEILASVSFLVFGVFVTLEMVHKYEYEMYSVLFSRIACYSLMSTGSVVVILIILKFRKLLRFGKTLVFFALLILFNIILFSSEYIIYMKDKNILNEQRINQQYISEQTNYLNGRQQYFENVALSYIVIIDSINIKETYPLQTLSKNILFLNIGAETLQIYVGYLPNSSGGGTFVKKRKSIDGDFLTLKVSSQERPRMSNSRPLGNSRELIAALNDNFVISGDALKIALQETASYFSAELSNTQTAITDVEKRGMPFHYFILTTFNRQDSFSGSILIIFLLTIHIIGSVFIAGYITSRCYNFFDKL